jgi:hypothetical protein
MEPRRDDVLARTFGRALGEDGRLHFDEPAVAEPGAEEGDDLVPKHVVAAHALAAQIEIAVLEPQLLGDVHGVLVHFERRGLGLVEHLERFGQQLDASGGQVGVAHLLRTLAHRSGDAHGELRTQHARLLEQYLVRRDEDDLQKPGAVPKVDEGDLAHVTAGVDPSADGRFLAYLSDDIGDEFSRHSHSITSHFGE